MWALYDKCDESAKNVWKEHAAPCNAFMVEQKIKDCTVKLATWSKIEFGHVQSKIRELELSLRGAIDIKQRDMILSEISQWRRKEEIL